MFRWWQFKRYLARTSGLCKNWIPQIQAPSPSSSRAVEWRDEKRRRPKNESNFFSSEEYVHSMKYPSIRPFRAFACSSFALRFRCQLLCTAVFYKCLLKCAFAMKLIQKKGTNNIIPLIKAYIMNLKRTCCCNMKFIFIVNWMRVLVERPKRKRLRNVSTRLRLLAEREKPVAVEIKSRNSRTAKTFNYPIKGRTNWHEESMSASPYKSIRRKRWQKPERKRRCSREHCRRHCFISLHILVTIIRNDNKKWTSTKIKRWKNTKNLLIRFTLQAMPRFRNVYSFLRSLLRGQPRVTTWRNLNKFNSLQFEYLIHYGWGVFEGCVTSSGCQLMISEFRFNHYGWTWHRPWWPPGWQL